MTPGSEAVWVLSVVVIVAVSVWTIRGSASALRVMTFVSLKVTMIFQALICFGIIASTVTVNLANIKAHLLEDGFDHRHGHRGGVDDWSEVETVALLNDTKFTGYIVSSKAHRYNHSKTVLDKLGIRSHQYVPLPYKSERIHQAMERYHAGNPKYLTDKYKKVFSNRLAFTDLFERFIDDKSSELRTWRFFFEDDIALHPFLTQSLARRVLARGVEVAAADGIVYLGICGPTKSREKVVLSSPVEAMRCSGACTHAFGLTKWKTGGFLTYMDKLRLPEDANKTSMYFDQLLQAYGEQVHKIWVLGSNLWSPQDKNHIGLVFQDRTNYPSVINTQDSTQ